MRLHALLGLGFLILPLFSYPQTGAVENTVSDIDGNTYKTVTIGAQVWMAENLKVSRYRNGEPIGQVIGKDKWKELTGKGGWCYPNDDSVTGKTFGKLYNWFAVSDPSGICPQGWHVPGDAEWQTLIQYLGGNKVAGGKLKATALWDYPNEGATNSTGFTAVPAGVRYFEGKFFMTGSYVGFWSSTEANRDFVWMYYLESGNSKMTRIFFGKRNALPCRCLKD